MQILASPTMQALRLPGDMRPALLQRNSQHSSMKTTRQGDDRMIRRKFIGLMTLASAGSMVALETVEAAEQKTVIYRISGFTCINCTVGMETLLQKERGVVWANANDSNSTATIMYHPKLTSESSLVEFIESAGFKAHKEV